MNVRVSVKTVIFKMKFKTRRWMIEVELLRHVFLELLTCFWPENRTTQQSGCVLWFRPVSVTLIMSASVVVFKCKNKLVGLFTQTLWWRLFLNDTQTYLWLFSGDVYWHVDWYRERETCSEYWLHFLWMRISHVRTNIQDVWMNINSFQCLICHINDRREQKELGED